MDLSIFKELSIDGVPLKELRANGKLIWSALVKWEKYNCDVDSTRTYTYKDVDTNDYGSIGDSLTIEGDHKYASESYSFDESWGWSLRSPFRVIESYSTAVSQTGKYIGQHYDGSGCDWIGQITSVDGNSSSWTMTVTLVALCELVSIETTYTYSQGSTSYGTVEADKGALPENGTLVEGSVADGYCVLEINGTYFYYVLKND